MNETELTDTGEIYAKSPMTGSYYRVTEWEVVDDERRIISHRKEEVERDDVPDEWLEELDE